MPTIEDAIALATEAHRGQTRPDGTAYILHPLRHPRLRGRGSRGIRHPGANRRQTHDERSPTGPASLAAVQAAGRRIGGLSAGAGAAP